MNRIKQWLQRFMMGRYGTDKLNMWILGGGLVLCIVSIFVPFPVVDLALTMGSYALMIWAIFRTFSRNTYKRYRENRRFLMMLDRIKDREHRYFDCPKCRQPVRVPRGKGKISINTQFALFHFGISVNTQGSSSRFGALMSLNEFRSCYAHSPKTCLAESKLPVINIMITVSRIASEISISDNKWNSESCIRI